ncbi:MAG: hypothetical protein CM15mP42_09640 [Methanobacteriota archaeon]|nr:MAG: hypothetical protein CM15mP42_09640 [Euryarchaeota archaeon]
MPDCTHGIGVFSEWGGFTTYGAGYYRYGNYKWGGEHVAFAF